MIFNFLVFVVIHHIWGVIVIMAIGAADRMNFVFLNGEMTVPAGRCLIVVDLLLMTTAAISRVDFLEFGMLEIFCLILIVTLLARYCPSTILESVRADGTGIGSSLCAPWLKSIRGRNP